MLLLISNWYFADQKILSISDGGISDFFFFDPEPLQLLKFSMGDQGLRPIWIVLFYVSPCTSLKLITFVLFYYTVIFNFFLYILLHTFFIELIDCIFVFNFFFFYLSYLCFFKYAHVSMESTVCIILPLIVLNQILFTPSVNTL